MKAFTVNFCDIEAWNPASQLRVKWNWPDDSIMPLGSVLDRRVEPALEFLKEDSYVRLLTIRFDGSIEQRSAVRIGDVKGKLFRVRPGDVIFSKIDVRNGAIGVAPDSSENMCATSEYPIYSINSSDALPEYLALLFRTKKFKKMLNAMSSGSSGRKRVQPSQLEKTKVPIPKMFIQQKISEIWKEAIQSKNSANDGLQILISELDTFLKKQTVNFDIAYGSKIFAVNYESLKRWDLKNGRVSLFNESNAGFMRLGNCTEECVLTVDPSEHPDNKWPLYGVDNKRGVFFNKYQHGSQFNSKCKLIKEGWFFHNPARANVGSFGLVGNVLDGAITSSSYVIWKLTGGIHRDFMALVLETEYFLKLVTFNRVGSVRQNLTYECLAEIRLPIIPEDTQMNYGKRRQKCFNLIHAADNKFQKSVDEIDGIICGDIRIE